MIFYLSPTWNYSIFPIVSYRNKKKPACSRYTSAPSAQIDMLHHPVYLNWRSMEWYTILTANGRQRWTSNKATYLNYVIIYADKVPCALNHSKTGQADRLCKGFIHH